VPEAKNGDLGVSGVILCAEDGSRILQIVEKLYKSRGGDLTGPQIGVWGLRCATRRWIFGLKMGVWEGD
jgi:hypothetical protein